MPCYHPIDAWQSAFGGPLVFKEQSGFSRQLRIPCGQCIGCRSKRVRAWAIRCMHEAQMHEHSSFITLTYDEAHYVPSLNHQDFKRFVRRLRKVFPKARYFMCGEYGENFGRPHFHALLFGVSFVDLSPVRDGLFRSPQLERLWRFGFSTIGSVTYESAQYCAQYAVKRVNGDRAADYYTRLDSSTGEVVYVAPEYGAMSLKPGIGFGWFHKYWRECYLARDGVVLKGGRTVPAPRYYDKLLEELDYSLLDMKSAERWRASAAFAPDTSPERLLVREAVHSARLRFHRRSEL